MRQALRTLGTLTVVAFASALLSCSGGGTGGDQDCDYILAAGLSNGADVSAVTDRQCPSFVGNDWELLVDFAGPPSGAGTTLPATDRSRFFVSHYDVTYRNDRTGGTTPGVDVPFPIRVPISSVVDEGSSLLLEGWPYLEPGQKLAAPLNNSSFYPPGGVSMTASITWWGHPVSDPDAWCFTTMPWIFTIYDSGVPQTGNCE